MKNITIYIFFVLMLNSCALDEYEYTHISQASAEEFKEVLIQNRTVHFTIVVTTPTPCYGFNSSKSEKVAKTIQTKIFVETSSKPCIQVISSIEVELKFTVPEPGEYTFLFWQYDDEYLETTLLIQ